MEKSTGGKRLLIVEDEKIIRSGLVRHLSWQKLGISEVRAAQNAGEAFAIIEEFTPDIVLSDIKMPGMNGVEMCRKLSRQYPELQIIFLTGYVEKEYLKAAIDLKAVSYIEKPIALPEVQKAVRKAVENLAKESINKEAVLHRILMNKEEAEKYLKKVAWCRLFLIHVEKEEDISTIKTIVEELRFLRNKDHEIKLNDQIGQRTIAFLAGSTEETEENIIDDIQRFFAYGKERWQGGWFIAVGRVVYKSEEILSSFYSAKEALKSLAYMGWNHSVEESGEQEEYHSDAWGRELMEQFRQKIVERNTKEALELMDEFYHELINRKVVFGYSIHYMTEEFKRIIDGNGFTIPDISERTDRENVDDNTLTMQAETLEELCLRVRKYLQRHMLCAQKEEKEDSRNRFIIQKVIMCMREEYRDPDLSVRILAERVYLTPTYLSGLFKKQTGVTIGQYLTDLRIEQARHLLEDPQYKLYQISELAGYRDPNYFARIFKKKTGMTPSEYRENRCL